MKRNGCADRVKQQCVAGVADPGCTCNSEYLRAASAPLKFHHDRTDNTD